MKVDLMRYFSSNKSFWVGILLFGALSFVSGYTWANGLDTEEPPRLKLTAAPLPMLDDSVKVESEADSTADVQKSVQTESSKPVSTKATEKTESLEEQFQKAYDPKQLFAEASPAEENAFQGIARNAMPMTPKQIVRLKEMLNVTQRASASTGSTPPKPTLSTQVVNLSPGATPPVIRLQQGFVTSVVFVDGTGADWPIEAYDLGNSRAFDVQWQNGSNVLMLQALSMYTYGNLAVKLANLSTPVVLTLVPGQKKVDYRIDLRIEKRGPNAKARMDDKADTETNSTLLNLLDGVAPNGSRFLQLSGDNSSQAWAVGNYLYLRTQLTVLSPGWISKMTSPDGTNVYEMIKTPSVLVSKYGQPIELKLED
jgi:intracellular multiplication protein IcmK